MNRDKSFEIDSETGEVTLTLDSESIETYSHEFTVTVTTTGGSFSSHEVTIGPFIVNLVDSYADSIP
jgi:hypothetical protein